MRQLSDELIALLGCHAVCYFATIMPDGSPAAHPDLVRHRRITHPHQHRQHPSEGSQRQPGPARGRHDLRSGPSVWVLRCPGSGDQCDHRGGAADHIEALSQRYLGGSYPWRGGRDQTRRLLTIDADRAEQLMGPDGDQELLAWVPLVRGVAFLEAGRTTDAARQFVKGAAQVQELGGLWGLTFALLGAGLVLRIRE